MAEHVKVMLTEEEVDRRIQEIRLEPSHYHIYPARPAHNCFRNSSEN